MALSFSASAATTRKSFSENPIPKQFKEQKSVTYVLKCLQSDAEEAEEEKMALKVGSPIIIVEAPLMLKTATSVPCLRRNAGAVKAGDVGRIISRKPKDTWAIRLAIGTYLIDSKYFKALQVEVPSDNNPIAAEQEQTQNDEQENQSQHQTLNTNRDYKGDAVNNQVLRVLAEEMKRKRNMFSFFVVVLASALLFTFCAAGQNINAVA